MPIRPASNKAYVESLIKDYNDRISAEDDRSKAIEEAYQNRLSDKENAINEAQRRDRLINRRSSFSQAVKSLFLNHALVGIVEGCLSDDMYRKANSDTMIRSMVSNYVNEVGADNILHTMDRGGPLMHEMAFKINKYYRRVLKENEGKTAQDLSLDPTTRDEFYDSLDLDSAESVTERIRQRVADSIQDWMYKNAEEKEAIKATLDATNAQMEKYSGQEEVQECYAAMGKRRVAEIRNKEHGLFHNMVEQMCKRVLKTQSLHETYMIDGKLNLDQIVENCEIAYTFMEALASLRICNRDEMAERIIHEISDF